MNLDSAVSFDEFFDTQLLDILSSGGDETTFYDYENDNLSNELTIDNIGVIRAEVFYNYTFNNNQVTNRESITQLFNADGSLDREIVTNIAWNGDIPLSSSTSFSSPVLINDVAIDENSFIFETNSLGQIIRTFEVIDGENVLSSESEFSSINNGLISIGDESIHTVFDTVSGEIRQQSFYSYNDETNTIISIEQLFSNNEIIDSVITFIIHVSELNQTLNLIFDLEEFENDTISNVTIFSINYFETDSCGDYAEMEAAAFNDFIPICITDLTYNN